MDLQKEREAFELSFKSTQIYCRECAIRGKDILEFSKTMNGYFNIVTNDAWNMWLDAKAQANVVNHSQLDLAVQQILGWFCAKQGVRIGDLAISMGLTKTEWETIKKQEDILSDEYAEEMDEYFSKVEKLAIAEITID